MTRVYWDKNMSRGRRISIRLEETNEFHYSNTDITAANRGVSTYITGIYSETDQDISFHSRSKKESSRRSRGTLEPFHEILSGHITEDTLYIENGLFSGEYELDSN